MRGSGLLTLTGALLFVTVCAYIFCGLYGAVDCIATVRAERVTVDESAELYGIAVRREQALSDLRYIAALAQDGARLKSGALLAQSAQSKYLCPCSAVFFSQCDGFENLTPEDCGELTVSVLQSLLESAPAPVGSAFGRLVTDYVWYYAAFADADAPVNAGDSCNVLFDGFERSVPSRVLSVSDAEGGKRAVLLRLTAGGDWLRLRRCGARLVCARHSGLAVPSSALRHDAAGDYVYVVSAGVARRRDVAPLFESGGNCVVAVGTSPAALCAGDTIITGGDKIYEGCVIG